MILSFPSRIHSLLSYEDKMLTSFSRPLINVLDLLFPLVDEFPPIVLFLVAIFSDFLLRAGL